MTPIDALPHAECRVKAARLLEWLDEEDLHPVHAMQVLILALSGLVVSLSRHANKPVEESFEMLAEIMNAYGHEIEGEDAR